MVKEKYGLNSQNNNNEYKGKYIQKLTQKYDIEDAIRECDNAFLAPVCERVYYKTLIDKISKYASVYIYNKSIIMGYIAVYMNNYESRTAYITLLGVKKEYQNLKIGTKLMIFIEDEAKGKGFEKIKLEVRKENKKAISFYKKNNYKIISEAYADSFYMEKVL